MTPTTNQKYLHLSAEQIALNIDRERVSLRQLHRPGHNTEKTDYALASLSDLTNRMVESLSLIYGDSFDVTYFLNLTGFAQVDGRAYYYGSTRIDPVRDRGICQGDMHVLRDDTEYCSDCGIEVCCHISKKLGVGCTREAGHTGRHRNAHAPHNPEWEGR